jgi:energy-coupling factor transport system ATP-binding protein
VLHQQDPAFPIDLLTIEELVETITERISATHSLPTATVQREVKPPETSTETPKLIEVRKLVHYYMRGTPLEVQALHAIDIAIHQGEIVGIIGHTGSGKSTVIQHFNGLLRPHGGRVQVFDQDLGERNADVSSIRRRVGLVFQFPETQLFERYVGDDIAFGPRNLKLDRAAIRERVRRAMRAVGLDFDEFKDRMTFGLSGGQLRRVALAGVLALEPEILVLDEPTAGLDPQGRRQLLDHLRALHAGGMTLVIVSHNMEELAAICDRLYVLADGRTVTQGTPQEIFAQPAALRALQLDVPDVTAVIESLVNRNLLPANTVVYTVEQAGNCLQAYLPH